MINENILKDVDDGSFYRLVEEYNNLSPSLKEDIGFNVHYDYLTIEQQLFIMEIIDKLHQNRSELLVGEVVAFLENRGFYDAADEIFEGFLNV
jgi:hypothetical protein